MSASQDEESLIHKRIEDQARPYLDLVDELRKLGIEKDFPIPQIAVMGDQSAGKSSVLEAICNIPFPRGAGLVTRCATQISLKKTRLGTPWMAKIKIIWFHEKEGLSLPEEGDVAQVSELGERIKKLSASLVGITKGATFSKDIIAITIESPSSPDLTVVDLPGIVRTRTKDQAENVVEEVDTIVNKYLSQKHTIVLAVVPANVDIATVDILERAKKFDPEGDRTIGVVTKPDLVDTGAEQSVLETVNNDTKPLKLGYVVVKNRGQSDLGKTNITEARNAEKLFFEGHPEYSKIPPNLRGTESLTCKLTNILVSRIIFFVPEMLSETERQLAEAENSLKLMGKAPPETTGEKIAYLMNIQTNFASLLEDAIKGNYSKPPLSNEESLRLQAITHNKALIFTSEVDKNRPSFGTTAHFESLVDVIKVSRGLELPGFLSSSAFNKITVEYFASWKVCAENLCQVMYEEYSKYIKVLAKNVSPTFSKMLKIIIDKTQEICDVLKVDLFKRLDDAFKEETLIPSTMNHYFMATVNKIDREDMQNIILGCLKTVITSKSDLYRASGSSYAHVGSLNVVTGDSASLASQIAGALKTEIDSGSNEMQEAKSMDSMLHAYWKVSSKRFTDKVLQLIQLHFGFALCDQVKNKLTPFLMENIDDLFEVSENDKFVRNNLNMKIVRLKKAKEMMKKV